MCQKLMRSGGKTRCICTAAAVCAVGVRLGTQLLFSPRLRRRFSIGCSKNRATRSTTGIKGRTNEDPLRLWMFAASWFCVHERLKVLAKCGHEYPGVEDPMMKLDDLSEELNEEEAIPIGAMDGPPLIATAGHMPDGPGTLQTERSRHEEGRRKNRIRVAVDSSGWACGECHEGIGQSRGATEPNTSFCGSDPQAPRWLLANSPTNDDRDGPR